ncbi:MAG: KEOPS complex kinase/ATPase Bud32 [Candidatus Bathyarchaeia archaeon]
MDEMKFSLIKKGAEANLYLTRWHGRKAIIKKRLPKKYRPAQLDERIRTYRTIHEPQLISEAKKAGVPTPTIFLVDVGETAITMEFVEGIQVKQLLSKITRGERENICVKIGELIGRLHEEGIIHGDLTTSNMILDREGKIYFVDFGLGEKTMELEAMGVDLHLMKRALQSTHFHFTEECFNAVVEGYSKVLGEEKTKSVLEKVREIERRGRYVAERREKKA